MIWANLSSPYPAGPSYISTGYAYSNTMSETGPPPITVVPGDHHHAIGALTGASQTDNHHQVGGARGWMNFDPLPQE